MLIKRLLRQFKPKVPFARFSIEPDDHDSHTIELKDEYYLQIRKDDLQKYYNNKNLAKVTSFATKEGTEKYQKRKADSIPAENFKTPFHSDCKLSTIGIGTYVGSPEEEDDLKMFNAIIDSVLTGGINVIDTAINYRYMRSERVVAAAIKYLIDNHNFSREELFVSSKIGYLPEDSDNGLGSQAIVRNLIEDKLITSGDIAGACHCMHPNFLKHQLDYSLNNLGLETLDLLYLQNPAESQLSLIQEEAFFDRLKKSFEFMESMIVEKKIKNYGMATWVCFRSKPEEVGLYLNLEKVVKAAESVGGKNHGFKFIQVPINLMMPEAFSEIWQEITNEKNEIEKVRLLSAARMLKINVISSSPLLQGTLMQLPLPTDVFKCMNLGAKHLQFVRSIPAESLISTLVGQKKNRHVKTNIEVLQHPPLSPEEFWDFLLPPNPRKQAPDEPMD